LSGRPLIVNILADALVCPKRRRRPVRVSVCTVRSTVFAPRARNVRAADANVGRAPMAASRTPGTNNEKNVRVMKSTASTSDGILVLFVRGGRVASKTAGHLSDRLRDGNMWGIVFDIFRVVVY